MCTYMNDITILHLSDLHFDGAGDFYSNLLKGLLQDIKNELNKPLHKKIVITVTGDVLHKGSISALEKAYNFFAELKSILSDRVIAIYFVPGNHDKKRTDETQFLTAAYRSMRNSDHPVFGMEFFNSLWPLHLKAYSGEYGSGYLDLTERVYSLFGMDTKKDFVKNTFGVDIIEVLGKKICFILLNTAWSCMDESDSRNLIFGDFQGKLIKEQYEKLVGFSTPPDITIALGHHPIERFHGIEEDYLFSRLSSFEGLSANIYLCGHEHDRTVINWYNNQHSMSTLITGMGWPENEESRHVGNHYYSYYVINEDINSVDVYIRSTNDGGKFIPDFKIYSGEEGEYNSIRMPLRIHGSRAYMTLHSEEKECNKSLFFSNDLLNFTKHYFSAIAKLNRYASRWLEEIKNDFYESAEIDQNVDCDPESGNFCGVDEVLYSYLFTRTDNTYLDREPELKKVFAKNKKFLYDKFLGYLQRLCQQLHYLTVADNLVDGEVVRFHFQYLVDKTTYNYSSLCVSFGQFDAQTEYKLQDMKYGGLLEIADKSKKGMVYSVNEYICEHKLSEKWHNFITAVPNYEGNVYKKKIGDYRSKEVPYLVFGVTTNTPRMDLLLYCMDYYSIEESVSDIIRCFLEVFKLDIGDFCAWVKAEFQKEDL